MSEYLGVIESPRAYTVHFTPYKDESRAYEDLVAYALEAKKVAGENIVYFVELLQDAGYEFEPGVDTIDALRNVENLLAMIFVVSEAPPEAPPAPRLKIVEKRKLKKLGIPVPETRKAVKAPVRLARLVVQPVR